MQGEDQLRLVTANSDHAEAAATRLDAALRHIDVTLPSLSPQVPVTYRTRGLVDIGGAPYGEVDKLAAWIEAHHTCREDHREQQ